MPAIAIDYFQYGIYQGFLQYISERAAIGAMCHIILPVVSIDQVQRGETCKLAALATGIKHTACKNYTSYSLLYKDRFFSSSLRQIAKTHGSKVGEMYSVNSILQTSFSAGYLSMAYAPTDPSEYANLLVNLIHNNTAPIVFFDMDPTPGENYGCPYLGDGRNEHAAVIAAYYYDQSGSLRFITTQWGSYFDIGASDLAISSFVSLVDKREPETFVKIDGGNDKTLWCLKSRAIREGATILPVPERTASDMQPGDIPLKGKVIVVSMPLVPLPNVFDNSSSDLETYTVPSMV